MSPPRPRRVSSAPTATGGGTPGGRRESPGRRATPIAQRAQEANTERTRTIRQLFDRATEADAGKELRLFGLAGELIADGGLEALLTRPLDPLLHVCARRFQVGYLAHLLISGLSLGWAAGRLDVAWDAPRLAYLAAAVAGGSCLQAALLVLLGALPLVAVRASAAWGLYYPLGALPGSRGLTPGPRPARILAAARRGRRRRLH
jgi:hypothetical protein